MRVLVTGACGFIGSWLCEELVKRGYKVRALDVREPPEYLKDLKLEFFKVDISREPLDLVVRNVDCVVHLAALISAEESVVVPRRYHEVNVSGMLNLLMAMERQYVKKIVFASSAAVYGEPIQLPIEENHPLRPKNPYGATKVACEAYIHAFSYSYDLRGVILRLFNVYGPRQSGEYAGVISIFISRALRDQPLIIHGDGNQVRDFIYIRDVVSAIVKAIERDFDLPVVVMNIGTGNPTKIIDLARLVLKLTNKENLLIQYEKPRPGDIKESYASIDLAKDFLKWKPKTSLEKGLVSTIKWFKKYY
ncbi:MAG: nucleoside-diphosphate sugar epimerase [Thermoprotei archaeon]|nr:MAG: nucleoside-diphosphate sugar epimerase [Thermoprotei archaeon]RLE99472.1 MAG: nucleoside-diphosphate sugar epimerase [Thermoprotei archaeon]HDI74324.1 NAD-dependent epimerase/dehydratase family protein [Thermoprotei archaeon]